MRIINPATETVITEIAEDNKTTIEAKLKLLRHGQPVWKKKSVGERLVCIERFGDLIEKDIDNLAHILTSETGKPIQQSILEIRGASNRIEHLMANAEKWLSPQMMMERGNINEEIVYEPLGVIANISAWNYPYNVGYNVFLYALVAGNAVLYKPSEFATLTGLELAKHLILAGVPSNVFECITGDGQAGQYLLEADVDGYFFTGSVSTGRHIAKSVAPKMVPLQLELGGKDPLYVMDDIADIEKAAIQAAEGAFYNNGQSCCAVERIYAHKGIYEPFLEAFLNEVFSYRIGDPLDNDTFIGPLTRARQIPVLDDQVKDALDKGAIRKTSREALPNNGYYFTPTVLTNVDHRMKVMKEETFGPLIGIQKVDSDEEAIKLMNDTEYGLTAAVFSSDLSRAQNVFNEMNTGTVYYNCCDRVSPNVPWSGRKNSGLGVTLSFQGIRAFVQPKAYHWRLG